MDQILYIIYIAQIYSMLMTTTMQKAGHSETFRDIWDVWDICDLGLLWPNSG